MLVAPLGWEEYFRRHYLPSAARRYPVEIEVHIARPRGVTHTNVVQPTVELHFALVKVPPVLTGRHLLAIDVQHRFIYGL